MSRYNTPRAALRAAGLSQLNSAWARITYNKMVSVLEAKKSLVYAGNLVTCNGDHYDVIPGASGWPSFMHDVIRERPSVLAELTPELISAVKDRLWPQPSSNPAERRVQTWVYRTELRVRDPHLSDLHVRVAMTFLAHALGSVLTGEWS